MGETRTLTGEPGGLATLVRAALPALPGINQLPGVRKGRPDDFTGLTYLREGVVAERARVEAYAAVCGFPRKDVVPVTYPHLLAFPLHMAIMGAPTGGIEWRLPADLGRTYAAVSGDANPIHLYPLTAKALGFPRQIAHGMWTLARSVAAIENRLPEAVTVEVAFKKPVFLPGTVAFAARRDDERWTFAMTSPKDGLPHLLGRATPA